MEPIKYTTQRGITIGVVPIPLLLEEIRKAHTDLLPPTYTEHTAGGGKQEVEITEAMAEIWQRENPDGWKEHAEKWAAYERERDVLLEKLNDRLWQAVLRRSIVAKLPEDESWIAEQESFGLVVPTDSRERHIHYIRTEVVGGLHDILKLTAIANGADLSEEAVSLAEASFRYSMAGASLGRLADEIGTLAAGVEGRIDAGGQGVAQATE